MAAGWIDRIRRLRSGGQVDATQRGLDRMRGPRSDLVEDLIHSFRLEPLEQDEETGVYGRDDRPVSFRFLCSHELGTAHT